MISIIKYISEEMTDDAENREWRKNNQSRLNKMLQQDIKRQESQGTGRKIIKKVTPENTPVPVPPPEDHTIYTNPIKKFFNAIKQ